MIPHRLTRIAIGVWIVIFVAVSVRVVVSRPRSHNDYPTYANTGRNWLAGQDLYYQYDATGNYDDFRYSPLVAALFAAFTAVPDPVGNVLWRAFNLTALLVGLAWWGRRNLAPNSALALLFLLIIPLAVPNVNNGQCNLVILGSMLAGIAAAADKRWTLCAALLAFATLFKVYPVAIALLVIAVHPRALACRFALALGLGLLFPFLLHDTDYVTRQYQTWTSYWFQENRDNGFQVPYRDLRLVFRVWWEPLDAKVYLAIQLLTALAAAVTCVVMKRSGADDRRVLFLLMGFGCCWMTVFGLSAESCTYILVAPTLAAGMLMMWVERRPVAIQVWFWASFGLFLACRMAKWFPRGTELLDNRAADPIAGLLLLIGLIAMEVTTPREVEAPAEPQILEDHGSAGASPSHSVCKV